MTFEIKTKVRHNEPSKAIAKMASLGKAKSKALKQDSFTKRMMSGIDKGQMGKLAK